MPSLFSFLPARMPGVSISIANAVMPCFWSLRSVTASTVASCACVALVMKFLVPLRIQSSPSRTATVCIPDASEPEPGSVSAQQPIHSPVVSFGR